MKTILFFCGFIFIYSNSISQDIPEEKAWMSMWQRATVSIGDIKYDTIIQSNKKKAIPYYNILGTGVVFYVTWGKVVVPVVVTARHVIEGLNKKFPDSVKVRFSWHDDKSVYSYFGVSVPLKLNGNQNWLSFSDSSIDLACFPLLTKDYNPSDSVQMIPYSYFPAKSNYFEGEDVFVLGYPGSVGKNYWTRALVRKGIISWLPKIESSGQKFLIDCPVFPGNSGGPVFTKSLTGVMTHDTLSANTHFEKFIGIVIERRLLFNKVQTYKNGKPEVIKTAKDFVFWAPESISVAVVEPAENVYKLLKIAEEQMNKNPK